MDQAPQRIRSWRLTDHPVCSAKVASQYFLWSQPAPPGQEGQELVLLRPSSMLTPKLGGVAVRTSDFAKLPLTCLRKIFGVAVFLFLMLSLQTYAQQSSVSVSGFVLDGTTAKPPERERV